MGFVQHIFSDNIPGIMITPARIPRSLRESPAYEPDWRFQQTEEYLRCGRRAGEAGETYVVPLSERDGWVRSYFKFRTDAPTPRAAVCRYAQECDDTNDRAWMASRIRAMTVAGLTTAEIAERLHTLVENVDAFQRLFFDVGGYVQDRAVLGAILAPMLDARTANDARERIWLLAALKLGIRGLDRVLGGPATFSRDEDREISDAINSILAEQSLEYAISLLGRPEMGAKALEAFQRGQEMRFRYPAAQNDGKSAAFTEGLVRLYKDKQARETAERVAAGDQAVQGFVVA